MPIRLGDCSLVLLIAFFLILSLIYYSSLINPQSSQLCFPNRHWLVGRYCDSSKFLTYKKYWEMQEYLYISVYEAMWKGQTLEVSPFSLFVSLHFSLDEKQTLKHFTQIFLSPSEKTLKSRKTGVVKLWGLTWYVWELLCSESWLAVCILADKAVHCRTVNDEGVAGLTQETLQEPGRQKTTTSRAGK